MAAEDNTNFSMMADSGATDNFVDKELVPGIRGKMTDFSPIIPPREITTAGLHTVYGTAKGNIVFEATNSNGENQVASIPIMLVPGIGRHLCSSGSAEERGIDTYPTSPPRLEMGNRRFPLRKEGRLYKFDFKILPPRKSAPQKQLAIVTANDDTEK